MDNETVVSVDDLKELPNWICFNLAQTKDKAGQPEYNADGTPRMTKRPINPWTGYGAQSDDSRTWTDYKTAAEAVYDHSYSGVGFEFGASGICGVDLDHCIDDGGSLSSFAKDVVRRLNSYTEYSPSGRGLHILIRSDIVFGGKSKDGRIEIYRPRARTRTEQQDIYEREVERAKKAGRRPRYERASQVGDVHGGRFFTFTGNVYSDKPIADRTDVIRQLIAENFQKEEERPKKTGAPASQIISVDGGEVLQRAERGANGAKIRELFSGGGDGGDASAGDLALCSYLMYYADNDPRTVDGLFRQSARMRDKWDRRHYSSGETYGEHTLSKAVQQRTYSEDMAALKSSPSRGDAFGWDDCICDDDGGRPETALAGAESAPASQAGNSSPNRENAVSDPRRAVVGDAEAVYSSRLYAEGAGAVFIVDDDADADALRGIGFDAVAPGAVGGVGVLADALRKKPAKAALIICLSDGADAEKLKKGISKTGNHFTDADLRGAHSSVAARAQDDRGGLEDAAARAVRDCMRPDNAASYLQDGFDADMKRFSEGGKSTGFPRWDKQTTGLHEGLFMVASSSGAGKTTLCYQIAETLAAAGEDVLFFSLEQTRFDLITKSLARRCKLANFSTTVTNKKIKEGGASKRQIAEAKAGFLADVGDRLSIIPGNFSLSAKDIASRTERYIQRTGKKPVVIVDYLQALRPMDESVRKGVREAIDDTTDCLCKLKNDHELIMIVISSVSRANYYAPLDMDAMKESGRLEFSADAVWTLELTCINNDTFQQKEQWKQKETVRLAKKRNPRSVVLRCCKSRFSSVGDESVLKYYAAHDLFVEDDAASADFEPCDDADVPFDDKPTNPLTGMNRPRR